MFALALLAQILAAAPIPAVPARDAAGGRTIVRLVSRHDDISVTSTSAGVRYSAKDSAGRSILSNATLEQLKQQQPEIHRRVEAATAYAGMDSD